MSEDLTNEVLEQTSANLGELLTAMRDLSARVVQLESYVAEGTRPGWEKLHAGIAQLQEGQRRLEAKIDELVEEMRNGLLDIKRQLSALKEALLEVRAEYKDIEDTFIN